MFDALAFLPFNFFRYEHGRLGSAVTCADADGTHAAGDLERNAAVLYCTFSRGSKPEQVLRPEILVEAVDSAGELLRLIAEIEPSAGEVGDLVEKLDVGERLVLCRVDRGAQLGRLADAEGVDRDRDPFGLSRELCARQVGVGVDPIAEEDDRAGRVPAEAAALRDRRERVEERGLAEWLDGAHGGLDRIAVG